MPPLEWQHQLRLSPQLCEPRAGHASAPKLDPSASGSLRWRWTGPVQGVGQRQEEHRAARAQTGHHAALHRGRLTKMHVPFRVPNSHRCY